MKISKDWNFKRFDYLGGGQLSSLFAISRFCALAKYSRREIIFFLVVY